MVSVITDPRVVDRILHHRDQGRGRDPFAERTPQGSAVLDQPETPP